jgi:cytochrome c oxidase cbb3-type subunit 4
MDINLLRGWVAALSLAIFAGIVAWAWSRAQRSRFDQASQIPFADRD